MRRRVLVTGADGFIGKNLAVHLAEHDIDIVRFTRDSAPSGLDAALTGVDFVFHLAGINRPLDESEFASGNTGLTEALCSAIRRSKRPIPVVYTSSIQAALDNPYGRSKRAAEEALEQLCTATSSPVFIYQLPNVFGKWSRPNYNSAVATFCHNTIHGLPIRVNDPAAVVRLVYVDDVVADFLRVMETCPEGLSRPQVAPEYSITVGELAAQIHAFKDSRDSMITERVGTGLVRALYSTYLSFLPPEKFSYTVPVHADPRGRFVEMLKTPDSGQFSFFTAFPGVTRGGHYHHTKTEKFLVIQGKARFGFRHIVTGETHVKFTDGATPEIVETVPGWTHDITNVGEDEMIVMLWANEIFDRQKPDTIANKV